MFGYVRPALNRLAPEEKKAYQSAYCGLCHAMGRRHGFWSRFTLNYDFTLLALLHYGAAAEKSTLCCRCPAHPFRKPRVCLCGTSLDIAADQSMILMWYKLCDDIADKGLFQSLPARFLKRVFRKAYRRAADCRPEFDQRVSEEMNRLAIMEQEHCPQLDRVADTFAKILTAAATDFTVDDVTERAIEQFLYHLGRWIYLVDAWDDLGKDKGENRYNPLDARFKGEAIAERNYIETTMTHSVRLIHSAASLIAFGQWTPVVENIIFCGMPAVQTAVLDGQRHKIKKQRRHTDERSV